MSAFKTDYTDQETDYVCECGFREIIATDCRCYTCMKYQKNGLPLVNCPDCGQPFEEQ